ncbi:hypothetical protein [Leisingera caerulea]|uniref:hypothetical protein n=1 Tax=Leisingera caerulea TaxID=506591 RepID=UPI000403790B|nr:hypothetical protein [Leisingera caerulea]
MNAITRALEAGSRDQLSDVLDGKTADLPPEQQLQARLMLMERLVVLSDKNRAERQETARALLAILPDDAFIKAVAAGEGIDVYSGAQSEPAAAASSAAQPGTVSTVPYSFRKALQDKNGQKVTRALLKDSFADQLTAEQRAAAEELVLAYVKPLPASNAQANFDGYRALSLLRPDHAAYQQKSHQYEQAVRSKRAAIAKRLRRETDEFNGTTWLTHPNEPRYMDTRPYLSVYAGEKNGEVWLRMRLVYTSDSWLFVERASFNIDGKIVPLRGASWKRDNDSEIWEWADMRVDDDLRRLLERIASSKKTVVRFNGRQYYDNVTIREKDKQIIRDMFIFEEVYNEDPAEG